MRKKYLCIISVILSGLVSCSDNESDEPTPEEPISEEYYTGGELGTFFPVDPEVQKPQWQHFVSNSYEQPTPAVEKAGMASDFLYGEAFFEKDFNTNTSGVRHGLGPVYVRSACIICHPGYGHGKRMDRYRANDYGNGYLLVVIDENDNYVSTLTGMPQTKAVSPFLPPIDESGIKIEWKDYVDEFGNRFPDGETYSLIYPEVTIDRSAFNVPMPDFYKVRLEATIGVYGTGLIDAIPDDSLLAQYQHEKNLGYTLNDAKYQPENFIKEVDGTSHPGRYTYGLTRGTLQNGPGANAIWNITNVIRPSRNYHYVTKDYATAMSQNKSIQDQLGQSEEEIFDYLMSKELPNELSEREYIQFMIWHRGLAVPAARNLDDPEVKRGKELFYQIGCTNCHRPSWTTGADDYSGDPIVKGKLPRYPNQKIWPYTDLLQHRLEMVNNIRTGWCRTTPLWGRGLSEICTGAGDHLHDMRARNYNEAIMWHGGDGKYAREKYRNLSKEDRDALVEFLKSI
ncbi:di-heme oxidoredictase family protein [Parabacteroides sp. Marseille-P3160]|uniref:di-heme oxidoredictase family protein n=1 Tax=Parabacteroides sp. Marseille-P3160 TaxID=1917887 RepID=UPI0009BA1478|nr:di-heme oxidoredictase family protein [Parabacteroides sp. Marseille-P3160]